MMLCDELKPLVFSIADLAYVDEIRVTKNFQNPHDHAVYKATDVDAAIAEFKAKLESVQATAYTESVDAGMRERKLKRAMWLARAKEAWSNARWFNLCNPCYVRNRQGFTPNNENQKQMDSIEWARLFYNNYKKLIAKAEEYK